MVTNATVAPVVKDEPVAEPAVQAEEPKKTVRRRTKKTKQEQAG